MTDWNEWLDASLDRLASEDLLRHLRVVRPTSAVRGEIDGRDVVLYSSNDYLGLSAHPEVRRAAADAAESIGCGPRGSPLICGYTSAHQALEDEIAELKGSERALLFPTGYSANLAVMMALAGPGTAVYSDELNHASIVDGCRFARLSGAEVNVYAHRDVDALEGLLRVSEAQRHLIVTDAVFSMDGDLAPLPDLVELSERYGALLVVDEAHGTLVFGDGGGGVAEHFGVGERIGAHVGTLSKAVGALGGFIATSERLRGWLLNRSRSYVYSTALPLPVVEAARAGIRVARRDPAIRRRLWERVAQFGRLVGARPSSPIVPVVLGSERRVLAASRHLLENGLHVFAARPPTVPPGTSRLRVTLSAAHTPDDIEALARSLAPFLREDEGRVTEGP
jgi:8-amino-7-oxononanoate synthase